MKKIFILLFITIIFSSCQNESYYSYFTDESLRIDYFSIGNNKTESIELISLTKSPIWGGPHKNLIDSLKYGEYSISLRDANSNKKIYEKGFCTLFGEWRTTDEAKTKNEKYYNSQYFPMPKNKVYIDIFIRDKATMDFNLLKTIECDPKTIENTSVELQLKRTDIITHGDSISNKVDLTFVAEGYKAEQEDKFIADAKRFTDALFACKPYDCHKEDFNVHAIMINSDSSGVDHPGINLYRDTPLNSEYYTFGTERYLTTKDMKSVNDAIYNTPTDAVFILVNEQKYGGGGIYNFYAIGSSDNPRTIRVFTHELGHSFGGLGDEYFYSEVPYGEDSFYNIDMEPWEPNITTLKNFNSKWADMLSDSIEIPTPTYEDESQNPKIGVFEGGGYLSKGIYRPANHCRMRDDAPFCEVCCKSIEHMIDYYCDR